jgi:hypothetical protein
VQKLTLLVMMFSMLIPSYGRALSTDSPAYKIAKVRTDASGITLNVSVRDEDLAPTKLISLARVLREKYKHVRVYIFTSWDAALNFVPLGVEYSAQQVAWASKLHAFYSYGEEGQKELLLLTPDGLDQQIDSPINTRLDLSSEVKPRCKLEIKERCVLQFDHISVSPELVGSVTLTACLNRDGRISKVIVRARDNSRGGGAQLADWAVGNLRSWRVEPGKRSETISLVYSVDQVETPLKHGIDVQFMLPERITIHVNSPRTAALSYGTERRVPRS